MKVLRAILGGGLVVGYIWLQTQDGPPEKFYFILIFTVIAGLLIWRQEKADPGLHARTPHNLLEAWRRRRKGIERRSPGVLPDPEAPAGVFASEKKCPACGASTRGSFIICSPCGALVNGHRLIFVALGALVSFVAMALASWSLRAGE